MEVIIAVIGVYKILWKRSEKVVTKRTLYLFFLNKNPLFEKSDPELKRGGVINKCLLNSEEFEFLPKNQEKKTKNFPAASPRIFPKKREGY